VLLANTAFDAVSRGAYAMHVLMIAAQVGACRDGTIEIFISGGEQPKQAQESELENMEDRLEVSKIGVTNTKTEKRGELTG
jgi:acylphosphatase